MPSMLHRDMNSGADRQSLISPPAAESLALVQCILGCLEKNLCSSLLRDSDAIKNLVERRDNKYSTSLLLFTSTVLVQKQGGGGGVGHGGGGVRL